MDTPVRILQISDTHLFTDNETDLLGVNTTQSFQAVLNLVKAKHDPFHGVVMTGDLSQDGSVGSYQKLADLIKTLNVPVYCTPGNHDDNVSMAKIYPTAAISMQKQIILDHWQFILLDSHVQGLVEGFLDQNELNFLKNCLEQYSQLHAIILFHHHPVPVGSVWLDRIGLRNAPELWETLKPFSQRIYIIFGHVHQQHEGEKNGIKYYSVPSTCFQFKRNSVDFAIENLNPGFRVVDLYPNGDLKTHVSRLDQYVGKFDADARGY